MELRRMSRTECKAVASAGALATVLADFLTGPDTQHGAAACRLASASAQLASIQDAVAACPGLRVFGCSALLVYDAAAGGNACRCVTVRLVDFAHAFFTDAAEPDGNLGAGLAALRGFLKQHVARGLS